MYRSVVPVVLPRVRGAGPPAKSHAHAPALHTRHLRGCGVRTHCKSHAHTCMVDCLPDAPPGRGGGHCKALHLENLSFESGYGQVGGEASTPVNSLPSSPPLCLPSRMHDQLRLLGSDQALVVRAGSIITKAQLAAQVGTDKAKRSQRPASQAQLACDRWS